MHFGDASLIRLLVWPAALMLAAAGCGSDDALAQRQAEVAERGAQVMPFDLDATTHIFDETDDGGVQTVVADGPTDMEQVDLIRQHLREEQEKFTQGIFDDPMAIHGQEMNGVAELRRGYADIAVDYVDRSDGARLVYRTDRAELVKALHAWFGQQVMDHGSHAEAG